MAVGNDAYVEFFQLEAVQALLEETKVKLVVVNLETEEVMQWIV